MRWSWAFPAVLLLVACSDSTEEEPRSKLPDPSCPDAPRGNRPDILLVTVDTLRADALGCYGNAGARTPRLDGLAAEGVRFSDVWTVCPLTLPSHATILTGLLPPEHGLRDNDPPGPLPSRSLRSYPTLAETLAEDGYETAAFVSSSVVAARTGLDQGFATYDGPEEGVPGALRFSERRGRETATRAATWIAASRRPFFAWVHLFDPHDPYDPPAPFRTPAGPHSPEAYAAEVSYADRCVGILLDALDRAGVGTTALVVVTADHGEGLGEHGEPTHGYLLFDATLRVPLIARWPGRIPSTTTRTEPTSIAALYSTILAAAGREDHASILDGPGDGVILAESLYGYRHMGWAQLFAAKDAATKLILGPGVEVYDLRADPDESSPAAQVEAPALAGAIARYRILPLRGRSDGAPPEIPEGFPYTSGLGRGRLTHLTWEENAKLRYPDPRMAADLDRVKAEIGHRDPDAVEADLLALAKRDPANPSIHFWIGYGAAKAGRRRRAATAFARAFELGLEDAKVLNLWIQQLLLLQDLEGVAKLVRGRLSEVTPDVETYLMVGSYHLLVGDRSEARRLADLAEGLVRTDSERHRLSRFRDNLELAKDRK